MAPDCALRESGDGFGKSSRFGMLQCIGLWLPGLAIAPYVGLMARKIVLDGYAAAAVERLARQVGVSPAELIRRALSREDEAQRIGSGSAGAASGSTVPGLAAYTPLAPPVESNAPGEPGESPGATYRGVAPNISAAGEGAFTGEATDPDGFPRIFLDVNGRPVIERSGMVNAHSATEAAAHEKSPGLDLRKLTAIAQNAVSLIRRSDPGYTVQGVEVIGPSVRVKGEDSNGRITEFEFARWTVENENFSAAGDETNIAASQHDEPPIPRSGNVREEPENG